MSEAPPEKLTKTALAEVRVERSGGGAMLLPETMSDVVSFSQMMARAGIALPKHLRDQPGAVLGVVMQALRWEMDPFAVANKSYSVSDRLAYEAQLIAAVVHTRAPIKGRPNYVYTGEGPTRQCQVICTMSDGETREYTSPRFEQITTKNSPLWKSDPDQQLGYFAIRSWARRHTPEVILGVYAPEEVEQFRDITPRKSGVAERLTGAEQSDDKGFSRERVENALNTGAIDADFVDVETGEVTEAVAVAPESETPASEPESAPAVDVAADPPSPEPQDADPWATWDAAEWVKGQKDAATSLKDATKADFRAWWTQVSGDEPWMRLVKAEPKLAEDLKAHVQAVDKGLK